MAVRLRLVNESAWSARDLRGLILAGLAAEGDGRAYHVTVSCTRGDVQHGCSGYAYYNTGTMLLRVPRPADDGSPMTPALVTDFARVLVHELLHCHGIRHREMARCHKRQHRGGTDDAAVPWAAPWVDGARSVLPRPVRAPKEASPEDRIRARYARAEAAVKRWESKARRCERALRKARAKVARYARTYGPDSSKVVLARAANGPARPAQQEDGA